MEKIYIPNKEISRNVRHSNRKQNVKTRGKMKRFAVSKLKLIGVFTLKNKSISSNKFKDIFDCYKNTFGKCIYSDFINYLKNDERKKLENEISKKKKEINESEYIYVVGNKKESVCKIGYSKDPFKRIKSIQTGCPFKLHIFLIIRGNRTIEKQLHRKYKSYKHTGEWFKYEKDLKTSIENISLTDVNVMKNI